MKKILLSVVILIVSILPLSAGRSSFSYLKTMKVQNYSNIVFHYEKSIIVKNYNKSYSEVFGKVDSPVEDNTVVAEIKINSYDENSYLLLYSPGPSADPTFMITEKKDPSKVYCSFMATEIYIPGNGNIYTEGHTNSFFNIKRKYKFNERKTYEIKQQYYYCGMKTVTLKPVKLYKSSEMKTISAYLPVNYNVTVILMHGDDVDKAGDVRFLLSTDFGLTGWVSLSFGPQILKGIYYAGD